jgi:hypothetical protein
MSLRDMVKRYSSGSATATSATSAAHGGLTVVKVATVAVATRSDENERLSKRWQWFLSLVAEHGIHPYVVGAEFPTDDDRLDVVEPVEHDDDTLRACMATLCSDSRVLLRQSDHEAGQWLPLDTEGSVITQRGTA